MSDIHGNLPALTAVLEATAGSYDEIVCCGDLVGYGPWPGEVIAWAKENLQSVVRGNHDKVSAGLEEPEDYNEVAVVSLAWTSAQLNREERSYLQDLPKGPLEYQSFWLLHGSPANEDQYLITRDDAEYVASTLPGRVAFFGHTHRQGGFRYWSRGVETLPRVAPGNPSLTLKLDDHSWYLINPGSVGQPRDLDPRAAAAIFDSERQEVEYLRVPYAVQQVEEAIRKNGLPEILGRRLFLGK